MPVQLPAENDALEDARAGGWRNPFGSIHMPAFLSPNDDDLEAQNDGGLGQLSYFERMSLFAVSLIGSFTCYALCIFLFPALSLRPKKFALIWTLGSILFLLAFGLLNGFGQFARHLVSKERISFSIAFLGSIVLTLVFSLVWKSTIMVIVACVMQIVASIYYTVSYAPYGRQGLNMMTGMGRGAVEGWLST